MTVLNSSADTKISVRGNIASLNKGTDDAYKTNYLTADDHGYIFLFLDCASLIQAPELPATTLSNNCYENMFRGCTRLVEAPELPASVLTFYCYYNMFKGCSSLSYVKCLATDISMSSCTTDWLSGVSSTGDFYTPATTNWKSDANGIPTGWTRHNT